MVIRLGPEEVGDETVSTDNCCVQLVEADGRLTGTQGSPHHRVIPASDSEDVVALHTEDAVGEQEPGLTML